jgi:glutathione S-transferase
MSRKLYATPRSPFARKIRILLHEKGLPYELVPVDLASRSAEFVALSPLGKVPLLVDEDGTTVFDSTVIAEYLEDRYPTPSVLGAGTKTRMLHRELDELADTVSEQSVTLFFAQEHGAPALDKASRVLDKALEEIERRITAGEVPEAFGLGQAAVLSALGYLAFRHGRGRIEARAILTRWESSFAQRPSLIAAPAPSA